MLRPSYLTVAALALACLVQPVTLAQETKSGPRAIGAGGFPVSFIHASAWFVHRADSEGKELTLMVYLEGTPGWHDRTTNFDWKLNQSPARILMSVGDTPIHIVYWPETSSVEILGSKFNLSSVNVFLVKGVDGPKPLVRALGAHDLTFAPDDNPAIVLLRRNEDLRAALTGQTPKKRLGHSSTESPEELVAWDREGLRLIRNGKLEDDQKACELFRRAAVRGYADSQYRLGYCYESGHGAEQDPSVANQWYEKAANQGHVDAQYKLGHSYRVGRGVEIDLATALRWYKRAAENGDLDALHNVGWMYALGQGVEADAEQAFAWFLRAAMSGSPGSQYEVARRLRDGEGVARDLASSYAWLLVVQAQRNRFALADWERIEELTQSLESQLDEAAKTKAKEQSQEWLRTLARLYVESLAEP